MRHSFAILLLAGCGASEPDKSGDDWALKTFGADGARELKNVARQGAAGELGAAWAPRPYVVIEMVSNAPGGGSRDPYFHPLNATLSSATSADAVQGVVVVQKIINTESAGTIRIKRRTTTLWKNKPVWMIVTMTRDENGRFLGLGGDMIEGHEDEPLRAWLDKLPPSAPAEE